jgi:hypothetical protein
LHRRHPYMVMSVTSRRHDGSAILRNMEI